jgi:uncharacterized membrane protein
VDIILKILIGLGALEILFIIGVLLLFILDQWRDRRACRRLQRLVDAERLTVERFERWYAQ